LVILARGSPLLQSIEAIGSVVNVSTSIEFVSRLDVGHDVGAFNRLCLVDPYPVLERVKGALRRQTLERERGVFVGHRILRTQNRALERSYAGSGPGLVSLWH
jgi:hypothetical protein